MNPYDPNPSTVVLKDSDLSSFVNAMYVNITEFDEAEKHLFNRLERIMLKIEDVNSRKLIEKIIGERMKGMIVMMSNQVHNESLERTTQAELFEEVTKSDAKYKGKTVKL